jgi:AcrR family transcriptional regulator
VASVKQATEVRQEQIARAALSVIGQDGMKGFTTVRIAREAGTSEANLYRHFKNKDAILLALIDTIRETLLVSLKTRGKDASALGRLEHLFRENLRFIEENRGIPRLLTSSDLVFTKQLRRRWHSTIQQYLKTVEVLLERGKEEGSVDKGLDAGAAASIFLAMVQHTSLDWVLGDFRLSPVEAGMRLWSVYREIIGSAEERAPSGAAPRKPRSVKRGGRK